VGEAQLGLGSLSLRPPRLLLTPLTLPPPHVVRLGGGFGRVCSVGEVVEVIPVGRGGAVHVVVPVADAELLVEAGLVGAHVGDPAAVLVTHVEYHAVVLHVGVEADGPVRAVEVEGDVGEVCPALLLRVSSAGTAAAAAAAGRGAEVLINHVGTSDQRQCKARDKCPRIRLEIIPDCDF